jgi:hypothetical protein
VICDDGTGTVLIPEQSKGLFFSLRLLLNFMGSDQQALDFIAHICAAAASTGKVNFGSLFSSVHQELNVALFKGIHVLFHAGVHL